MKFEDIHYMQVFSATFLINSLIYIRTHTPSLIGGAGTIQQLLTELRTYHTGEKLKGVFTY